MTPFEKLHAIAVGQGDVMAKAREIIGTETLALALVKLAFEGTTLEVSPTGAANVLDMDRSTASRRLDAIHLKTAASQ
jgi:hypothetical protein